MRHPGAPRGVRVLLSFQRQHPRLPEEGPGHLHHKPVVLVDGGPWYPWPLDRMGIRWLHIIFGERNAIERFFRTMKERTKRFYNNLPSDRLDNLESFLNVFMLWYNYLRLHQGLGKVPWRCYRNSILFEKATIHK